METANDQLLGYTREIQQLGDCCQETYFEVHRNGWVSIPSFLRTTIPHERLLNCETSTTWSLNAEQLPLADADARCNVTVQQRTLSDGKQ